jgi:hypothetical protein
MTKLAFPMPRSQLSVATMPTPTEKAARKNFRAIYLS